MIEFTFDYVREIGWQFGEVLYYGAAFAVPCTIDER